MHPAAVMYIDSDPFVNVPWRKAPLEFEDRFVPLITSRGNRSLKSGSISFKMKQ